MKKRGSEPSESDKLAVTAAVKNLLRKYAKKEAR